MQAGRPAPTVRLGVLDPDGIAPVLYALLVRAVERRTPLSRTVHGEIELRFDEVAVPLRIVFGDDEILVEDGAGAAPDAVVTGRLADVAQLLAAPTIGGLPAPTARHGRVALGRLATQRVRVDGRRMLARKLLALLALDAPA